MTMAVLRPRLTLEGLFLPFQEDFEAAFDKRRVYEKGELIHGYTAKMGRYDHYILSGYVNLMSIDEYGTSRIWSVHGPGIIFPLYGAYDKTLMMSVSAFYAAERVETLLIPHGALDAMLRRRPDLRDAMMDGWMSWCTNVLFRSEMLTSNVEGRLCSFLLLNMDDDAVFRGTQGEIAQSIDASRESVTRAVSDLKRQGAIRQGYRWLEVVDVEAVAAKAPHAIAYSSEQVKRHAGPFQRDESR